MTITLRPILFVLLATAFAACNNKPETPVVNQTEASKQIIDEHFRYLNDKDLKGLVAQYADKAKITTTDWDGETVGPKGADEIFHQVFYVSPDAKYLVDNVINTDSTVVVEYDVIGLKEKAGSPIRYDLRNASIFKIKSGKIVAEATYSNSKLYHNR
ncbi:MULTISPECIES: nuclear transport factor 2 family protein [unclassified Mucilaginibacter]|uniref:nuclear transport factor 2 family protein n=1 Tax=unclassified Mucilaginibacter TaxID=2617802 RepID=UPI002AC986CE|nr:MULTISPECIES: nuclear transport factor 2 family protein [unclassified Mucilaginibacter]MEB0262997.1 nuclear transport factor 2 family protein [Mucilaginibacter sp. 10I4]MEB0280301.1 nuclear transport factor 2 family protein [Mucilaginibacter sp. 10B2]MEB0300246.1 nuclear transport factor 2 family protein [Mucilaginibacter sp. 5C4]WPX25603.1 nuclear transport factor 2 family protein [Mucilaginibacter sp. 5C4]